MCCGPELFTTARRLELLQVVTERCHDHPALTVFLHGLLLLASLYPAANLWWVSDHPITLTCEVHVGVVQSLELLGLKADKTYVLGRYVFIGEVFSL